MDLRLKTSIIIVCVFAVLISSASVLSSQILLNSFSKVEIDRTLRSAERVKEAFNVDLENLNTKLADWAVWDDTYTFIGERNEDYIEKNLQPESFGLIKVSIMLFLDTNAQIVESRYYDYALDDGNFQPIPTSLRTSLTLQNPMLIFDGLDGHKEGIIDLPEGPLMVASRPIVKSDGSGPALGTLIFGRFLDSNQIDYYSQVTHFPLEIFPFAGSDLPHDIQKISSELLRNDSLAALSLDSKTIAGYFPLFDVNGKSLRIIRFQASRDIFALAKQSVGYFVAGLTVLGFLSVVIVIAILDRLVISPITMLRNQINKIRTKGVRIEEKFFRGEFLYLATDINEMLEALKLTEEQLAAVQRIAKLGGWQYEPDTGTMRWSEETYTVLGIAPGAYVPSIDAMVGRVFREDKQKFQEILTAGLKRDTSFEIHFRMQANDGTVSKMYLAAQPFFDESKKLKQFIGTVQVLTQLDQAEETILRRSQELEEMNKFMVDREMRMVELKKQVEELQKKVESQKKE